MNCCDNCHRRIERMYNAARCTGWGKPMSRRKGCSVFIPQYSLSISNEFLYVEQSMPTTKKRQRESMPTFLGKQSDKQANHPAVGA